MKTEEFERKDGTKGIKNIPEAGDVFTSKYASVRKVNNGGFDNYSLGVTNKDNEDIFIKITEGQKKGLDKIDDLEGKKIEFYEYTNAYGTQIGAGLKKE